MDTPQRFRPRPAHLALVALLALPAACGNGSTTHKAINDIGPDLHCLTEDHGVLTAVMTITNHSSKASSYFVDIEFTVDGNEIDTRTAVAEWVEPGEVVPVETSVRHAPSGEPTCEVTSVHRFKA